MTDIYKDRVQFEKALNYVLKKANLDQNDLNDVWHKLMIERFMRNVDHLAYINDLYEGEKNDNESLENMYLEAKKEVDYWQEVYENEVTVSEHLEAKYHEENEKVNEYRAMYNDLRLELRNLKTQLNKIIKR